ncbi:MAG TPA: hypothetical protein VFG50_12160 [Rhodothermales bacterium]|nr:hypothetical protein [Rhodothermales bacterium]
MIRHGHRTGALHQYPLIGKDTVDAEAKYSGIMGSMLSNIGKIEDDDLNDEDAFYRRYR